jgi:hypothetical protein
MGNSLPMIVRVLERMAYCVIFAAAASNPKSAI